MSYPLPIPSLANGYHLWAPIDDPGQPDNGLCAMCGGTEAQHFV